MNITVMTANNWKDLESEVEDNITHYHGKKVLYIKNDFIQWFEDDNEASKNGFGLLNAYEINKFASKVLADDTNILVEKYNVLLLMHKADNLLNSSPPPKKILEEGISLLTFGKSIPNRELHAMGRYLVLLAEKEFINSGNIEDQFECRAQLIKNLFFSENHPLFLREAVKNSSNPTRGVYFSRLDHGEVKLGSIHVQLKNVDGKELLQAELKVSYPCRRQLRSEVDLIRDQHSLFELKAKEWGCKSVRIREVEDRYYALKESVFTSQQSIQVGKALEIEFEGIGTIRIGNEERVGCSYNRIQIETSVPDKSGEFLQNAEAMLTAVGLKGALEESGPEDIRRRKFMVMYGLVA